MRKRIRGFFMFWVGIIFLLGSCSGLQQQVEVAPGGGEKVLAITASSFKFEPNNIKAYKGDILLLQIKNVSGSTHNFTIKNPEGVALVSSDLPAGEVTDVRVVLSEKGSYDFRCDKPFHSAFGMKGQIVVGQGD